MAADAFGEKSAALVGLIATLLGTLVAMGTFPDNPSTQGALAWNASVMAAGIVFVPVFLIGVIVVCANAFVRKRSPKDAVRQWYGRTRRFLNEVLQLEF